MHQLRLLTVFAWTIIFISEPSYKGQKSWAASTRNEVVSGLRWGMSAKETESALLSRGMKKNKGISYRIGYFTESFLGSWAGYPESECIAFFDNSKKLRAVRGFARYYTNAVKPLEKFRDECAERGDDGCWDTWQPMIYDTMRQYMNLEDLFSLEARMSSKYGMPSSSPKKTELEKILRFHETKIRGKFLTHPPFADIEWKWKTKNAVIKLKYSELDAEIYYSDPSGGLDGNVDTGI
jgi:hypothetical protein